MEKFVEKFNAFDLFSMLIPGIVISSLFGVSLSFQFADKWKSLGSEKYVLFFIFSYVCGLLFQELGTILDHKLFYRFLYSGDPRSVFLTRNKYKKIFNNEISYKNALKVKQYLIDYIDIEVPENSTEEDVNSLIFSFCLNICEVKGLSEKANKMIVISEMSRSLALGCIFTIFLNIGLWFLCYSIFLLLEIPLLFLISLVFFCRKRRYERYRFRQLLRISQFSFCRKMQETDNFFD